MPIQHRQRKCRVLSVRFRRRRTAGHTSLAVLECVMSTVLETTAVNTPGLIAE